MELAGLTFLVDKFVDNVYKSDFCMMSVLFLK